MQRVSIVYKGEALFTIDFPEDTWMLVEHGQGTVIYSPVKDVVGMNARNATVILADVEGD